MALVQLSDVIDVQVFQDLPAVNGVGKTAFAESGILVSSPLITALANADGKTAELPFWNDLDASDEVNYSSDDPTEIGATQNVSQGEQITRKAFMNKGWKTANLVNEISMGAMAMNHIRNRVDTYFAKQAQQRLIATMYGVMADNVANDGGDMVHDVSVEAIADHTAATKFNHDAFVDAAFTMGDMSDGITAIAVHSVVAATITKLNGAEDVRDSDGQLLYRSYLGRRIIVDDSLVAVAATTDGFKYTSVLFGPAVFGFGDGSPTKPVEVYSDAAQGNGAGMETLWVRKTRILHPFGFKNETAPAATSFTLAELQTAALWDRIVDRKNVNVAFLITNG